MQSDVRHAGTLIDDLLKALERRLIRLIGWNLCLKLKGIGGGKRAERDPAVFMLRPGMPVVAIEYVHLNVSHQHAFVFPGLPFKTDVEMFAEKASASVRAPLRTEPRPGGEAVAQQGRGHHSLILFDIELVRSPARPVLPMPARRFLNISSTRNWGMMRELA